MSDCDPDDFVRHTELDERCKGNMRWAETIISASAKDRGDLWNEVNVLKKLPGKVQTWFIIILITCIIAPYVVNRLSKNGEDKRADVQYQVSRANDANLQTLMKHLNLNYLSPQEVPVQR